jgi:hypothetical protein
VLADPQVSAWSASLLANSERDVYLKVQLPLPMLAMGRCFWRGKPGHPVRPENLVAVDPATAIWWIA